MAVFADPAGRPDFTLVVAVRDVDRYLAQCLDSIQDQTFGRFEVVAVDDASSDASPAILDWYASRDDRITVCHLPDRVGLGPARNHGIDRARGRYLLFVDGDDTLAPDALAVIGARARGAGDPDVVLFGFARTYPDGRSVPDPLSRRLLRADPGRAALLQVLPAAWNKAYRTDFVRGGSFRFGPGLYEDVPWTYPILMAASAVVTVDRVCYRYRQAVARSILGSSGRQHFDVLAQYDKAFSYLGAHRDLDRWRPRLLDAFAAHIPAVLDRLPPGDRREFFRAASGSFRRYRTPGYRPPGASAAVKVRLLEAGNYPAFRAAHLARRAARAVAVRARPGRQTDGG